jgi:methyl acetate hydrolase
MSEKIRAALEIGLKESGLPGVAIAAITPGGETVNFAVGAPGLGAETSLAPDAVFWIASMTKAITALAALQLVEAGQLSLDEPVGKWLPGLADPQVLEGFGEDGAPRLRPARGPITLRSLLTHTSGFGYDFASPDLARWLSHTGSNTLGTTAPSGLPLLFDPGEKWAYGHGIDFVGLLIEAATGKDLDAVFAEQVFGPLGMTDTGLALSPARRERLAPMHMRLPDGGSRPCPSPCPSRPTSRWAAAGSIRRRRTICAF